jgi:ABC-2 type transport system permease protein
VSWMVSLYIPMASIQTNLLRELVVTDFKIRYQNSVLGYLWSLIRPLSLFSVLYVVFQKVFSFGAGVKHYSTYLLLAIMLWTFFTEATSMAMGSIVDRGGLIKKVQLNKMNIVLSSVISAFINLIINLFVVFFFMLIGGVGITSRAWVFPILILELTILSFFTGLLLGSLYTKFRDIKFIWELFLQIAFYATPIIYLMKVGSFGLDAQKIKILSINPLTQIIQDARWALIDSETTTTWQVLNGAYKFIPVVIIIIISIVGYFVFRARQARFAEEV